MAMHLWPFKNGSHHMAKQARKRRNKFDSREHIQYKYKGRGAFTTWREPFLQDYILDAFDRTDGNDPDSDKQVWQLLCDPKWEAATFMAQRNRPWGALSKVKKHQIPITVLRPDRDSVMTDEVAARLTKRCPHLVLKERVNTTHFLPMEAPYDVRDQLSAYISSLIEGLSEDAVGPMKRTLST